MLTSIEGIYREGKIELKESPSGVQNETPVIVTFMDAGAIDLRERNISRDQAAKLQVALSTFEDWNEQEMDIYNDYDAAKSDL